jgi:hypothetical protein
MFTDECHLLGNQRRKQGWLRDEDVDKPENMIDTELFAKFHIMISGGIFMGGRTELDILNKKERTIDQDVYKRTV